MQLWKYRPDHGKSVVTLDGDAAPGTGFRLETDQNALSQLFQIVHSGFIVSALDSSLAWTATSDGSLTLQPLSFGNSNQMWTETGDEAKTIQNTGTGLLLTLLPGREEIVGVMAHDTRFAQRWARFNDFDCNYLLVTLTNATASDLTFSVNDDLEGVVPFQGHVPLRAGVSATFWSQYSGGLYLPMQIWNPAISSSRSVASFDAHQKHCGILAKEPWIDTVNSIDGYFLGYDVESGSHRDDLPGVASVTVLT